MPEFQYLGQSRARIEGRDKVSGTASYVADVQAADMTCARLILSPHPRARITRIDTRAAEQVAGVIAVFAGQDLETGLLAVDEVHYVGEPVAVVVAQDEASAEDGAQKVRVEYERMPAVIDPIAAMRDDSPLTRLSLGQGLDDAAAHGAATGGAVKGAAKPRNVNNMVHFERGDMTRAWTEADVVTETTYHIAGVHQGYLETQGSVARMAPDGALTVWTSTQGSFMARRATADQLALEEGRVRVVPMVVGGGFGGKGVLLEPLASSLSRRTGKTVRIILDRLQDFLVSNPAPAAHIQLRVGARRDGRLVGMEGKLVFDSGAMPGAPVGIAAIFVGGTYKVANLNLTSYEVLTNKTPVGAYRAPGAPQAYFALESAMDQLARKLSMDPIALRLMNAVEEGDERPDGRLWPRIGLKECLQTVAEHPMWKERQKREGRGYGLAIGGWMGGTEPAAAACKVNGDGSLTVQVGSVDITGTNTTMAMIAAEAFGVSPDKVNMIPGDTDNAPYAGMAGGSKITYTVGAAVLKAAEDARRQLLEMAADHLEVAAEDLEIADGRVQVRGVPSRNASIGQLARMASSFGSKYMPLHGQGRTAINVSSPGFAAHLAQVDVDRRTGRVQVTGYLAVQDVGRALNPAEVIGQIRGGVAQGIGRALYEEMAYDSDGQLMDANFADYALPTAAEIPNIEVAFVEVPSVYGPFGAKGVGEPPAVPGAAAVANAVEDATGIRVTSLPIRAEMIVGAGQSR